MRAAWMYPVELVAIELILWGAVSGLWRVACWKAARNVRKRTG